MEEIDNIKLCNLLPYGNYTIIDTRPSYLYEINTIIGSISCSLPLNIEINNININNITIEWITNNCIKKIHLEKFSWISLLRVILIGDDINDPWLQLLYNLFINLKFKYIPQYKCYNNFYKQYPLLFVPNGESRTFKKFRYPSEIIPNFLWLGSVESAQDKTLIENLKITHIVNATIRSRRNFFPDLVKYFTVDILDEVSEDMTNFFEPVNQFIDEAEKEGGRVLVHCQAGISRSACLTINYIRIRNNLTLKEALEYVITQRPEVHPNRSFMEQLIQQEILSNSNGLSSIQYDDIGPHGGVKEKVLSRVMSTSSSLSIENSEKYSTNSLNEPLVSISESDPDSPAVKKNKKKVKSDNQSGCCCIIM